MPKDLAILARIDKVQKRIHKSRNHQLKVSRIFYLHIIFRCLLQHHVSKKQKCSHTNTTNTHTQHQKAKLLTHDTKYQKAKLLTHKRNTYNTHKHKHHTSHTTPRSKNAHTHTNTTHTTPKSKKFPHTNTTYRYTEHNINKQPGQNKQQKKK